VTGVSKALKKVAQMGNTRETSQTSRDRDDLAAEKQGDSATRPGKLPSGGVSVVGGVFA